MGTNLIRIRHEQVVLIQGVEVHLLFAIIPSADILLFKKASASGS